MNVDPTRHLIGPTCLILSNYLLLSSHLIRLLVHLDRLDSGQCDTYGCCGIGGVIAGYNLDAASVEGCLLLR